MKRSIVFAVLAALFYALSSPVSMDTVAVVWCAGGILLVTGGQLLLLP